MMEISALQKARSAYQPKLPKALQGAVKIVEGAPTQSVDNQEEIKKLFPNTYGMPLIEFAPGNESCQKKMNVGIILSGGQAPGGHNVISGLFDAVKKLNPENRLYGFLMGPGGLVDHNYIEITSEFIDPYRNTGGFDMIGSGRTKLEKEEQFEKGLQIIRKLDISAIVIIGGDKRIGVVTEKLVPFMAAFYIIGAIVIIAKNIRAVPGAFALIFGSAFSTQAMTGGFAGASVKLMMKMGISRGVFTNEAGLGTAPIAHAAATTDHPVRQGMWGIFEVLMDTLVICTMTALVIIVTGQWNSGLQGAVLTTTAFETGFKGGSFVVAFGLTFFAFSTILGWAYYGERCMEFLFGKKSVIFYRIVFIPAIVVGSIGGLQAVWAISDTLNGLMAIPNLIAIFMLQGVVVSMVKDFFADPDYVRESHHEYISALPITEEDKKAVGNLIMK